MKKKNIMLDDYYEKNSPESLSVAFLEVNYPERINNKDDLVEALVSGCRSFFDYYKGISVNMGMIPDDTVQVFRFDFFDEFDDPMLVNYLMDEDNNYRITRLDDDTIIRFSREDLKNKEMNNDKKTNVKRLTKTLKK